MSQVSGVATVLVTQNSRTINLGVATDLISCYIETRDYDFDDPQALKYIEEIIAEVYGNNTIDLSLKRRSSLKAELVTDGVFPVGENNSDPVFCWSAGDNYFRVRFADETATGRWKIVKFEIFGQVSGKRY